MLNHYRLIFKLADDEEAYRRNIFQQTVTFCRWAWMIVIFLGSIFALMDQAMFPDSWRTVLLGRVGVISVGIFGIVTTFIQRFQRYYRWNSLLFIITIGGFCLLLISRGAGDQFSPYFVGIFFAYTGVFITIGVGFIPSMIGMGLLVMLFETLFIIFYPVEGMLLIFYNFFLMGIMVVFGFLAYYIEYISRRNYLTNQALKQSNRQVKQLSGLLPICASCKKIRDDNGYWNQLEQYLVEHADLALSHSICPECVSELYPDLDLNQ